MPLKNHVLFKSAAFALCAAAVGCGCFCKSGKSVPSDGLPILICNEDNDRFFYMADRWHTAEGIRAYFDTISAGGAMTHYFMCVNGQRTSYDSKVWEPIWRGANDPRPDGRTNDLWCVNAKKVHDRGLDPWKIWIDCARKKGISPWISMRMNDTHFSNVKNAFRNERRFYERTDLWCSPKCAAYDYSKADVREHALALVEEILDRWDADGIELDWLRFPCHFPFGRGPEFAHFITDFTRDVRCAADRAAKRRGHPVKVGARVPTNFEAARAMGLDAEAWAREGLVDALFPCNFYSTADFLWDSDVWTTRIRAANQRVVVVPGFCNMASLYPKAPKFSLDADKGFLRAWASLYGGTSAGFYVFNAFYFGADAKSWLLSGGLAPSRLSEGSRRYLASWHDVAPKGCAAEAQLPRPIAKGATIRVRTARLPADRSVRVVLGFDGQTTLPSVRLNGTEAEAETSVDLGAMFLSKNVKAAASWTFPTETLTNGLNRIDVAPVAEASAVQVVWAEIAVDIFAVADGTSPSLPKTRNQKGN